MLGKELMSVQKYLPLLTILCPHDERPSSHGSLKDKEREREDEK